MHWQFRSGAGCIPGFGLCRVTGANSGLRLIGDHLESWFDYSFLSAEFRGEGTNSPLQDCQCMPLWSMKKHQIL